MIKTSTYTALFVLVALHASCKKGGGAEEETGTQLPAIEEWIPPDVKQPDAPSGNPTPPVLTPVTPLPQPVAPEPPRDTTPPSVDAGADLVANAQRTLTGTTSDDSAGALTHAWTKVSGPGALTFGTASANATTVSADAEGTYVIKLTATDAAGNAAEDTLTLVWDVTPPVVDAGSDAQSGSAHVQTGTATDALALTLAWTQVSGPAGLVFSAPNALATTLAPASDGTYVVKLTATDAAGNTADDTATFVYDASAPSVDAGTNRSAKALFTQDATATSASAITSYQWTKRSGPGGVTFGSATAEDTTISVDADGTYELRLTVVNAVGGTGFDEMTLTWDATNPVVTAPADVQTAQTSTALDATVTDTTALTTAWTQVSGPGTATFTTPSAVDTSVSVTADGTYVFRLTATDALANTAFDEMSYLRDTQAPVVNAGLDLTIATTGNLDATVTDLTALTYAWTKVSGPGVVAFGDATAADTTVSASLYGTYVLRLTATDALGNTASDDMTLKWTPFSFAWSFTTPADYTFDPTRITVAGGTASLTPVALSDARDTIKANFDAGTHGNTEHTGGLLKLNAAGLTARTGTFTSRVFDATTAVDWTSLSWTVDRPYQRDLPNGGVVETTFDAGNVDMSGNRLLLHLNEADGATSFADGSGQGNGGTCSGNCPASTPGRIGKASAITNDHIAIPDSPTTRVTGNATWSAWVYGTAVNGCHYILEKGKDDTEDNYALLVYGNKLAFEFMDTSSTYQFYESAAVMTANAWTHVAVVYDDTANEIRFYRNGALIGSPQATAHTIKSDYANPLWIGRQNYTGNDCYWTGHIDEVAIFGRALSAPELLTMYQRGDLSVRLQVRGCDDDTCSTNPAFLGPDGTAATYFDGNNASPGAGAVGTITGVTSKRFLQYRTTFDTYTASITPAVKAVNFAQFLDTNAVMTMTTGHAYDTLATFDEVVGPTHAGGVVYQLSPDGTSWYWHDGTTWTAASAGVTHANTAATVKARIGTFAAVVGPGTLRVRAYFQAPTGSATIELLDVAVSGTHAP